MKLLNLSLLATISVSTASGLLAMNVPTLEQYKAILAADNSIAIINATKRLWYNSTDGIHLHWSGNDFQIVGHPKELNDGTYLQDAPYRKALHDYVVKQVLHPAMYGTADISQTFAKIDALSNNGSGIFGTDPRDHTQLAIKHAIIANRPNDRAGIALGLAFRLFLVSPQSINNLVIYVGRQAGEGNLWSGKLPLRVKLADKKHMLSIVGVAIILSIGYTLYTKYYAAQDKKTSNEDEENADMDENLADAPKTDTIATTV